MRLPKRVPWASLTEFEQVCNWIFRDEKDVDNQTRALNRLAAWQATTTLPHALESTMSLLAATIQDKTCSMTSRLSLRQSYSSAIIRMVNGFVDPLQSGVYARSIASISQQIGLPLWFVEVRHAATHEDLPSLELLREASRQSMAWLLQNYFLPTLSPLDVPPREVPPLRDVSPILIRFKSLLKATNRDASLKSVYKNDISLTLRELERWISEAIVSIDPMPVATTATSDTHGRNASDTDYNDDNDYSSKERSALEQLCDSLLKPGALVPLSKKKRTFPSDSYFPPTAVLSIWTPLIDHLTELHPAFIPTFCSVAVWLLVHPHPLDNDASYLNTVSRWIYWAVTVFEGADIAHEESESLRGDLCTQLFSLDSGSGTFRKAPSSQGRLALMKVLCREDKRLESLLDLFMSPISPQEGSWGEDSLSVLEKRLNAILVNHPPLEEDSEMLSVDEATSRSSIPLTALAPGIHLANADEWEPCPIGVHHSIRLPVSP